MIDSANDLYVAIKNNDTRELKPWSIVAQDIIQYLRKKIEKIEQAVVYKGSVNNVSDLNNAEKVVGNMYTVVNDHNNNYVYTGSTWINLGTVYDTEAIQNSKNAVESNFIYNALINYATYEQIQQIIDDIFGDSGNLSDITRNINDIINVINNDISDLQGDVTEIKEQLTNLENTNNVKSITTLNNNSTIIDKESDNTLFYKISGNVTLNFVPSNDENFFTTKYIYIEIIGNNTNKLIITNASWSMLQEDPTFTKKGCYILAKAIWIANKVIIETIDINQLPTEILSDN